MSKIPPHVLEIVERPGADWTPEQLANVCAWLGEREQRDSLIFRALQCTRDKAINFTEADVENALDNFYGHKRRRFNQRGSTDERRQVVTELVAQKQITLPADVAEYLAREIRSNRRVLEQTVLDFISYARASAQRLTVQLAERFIEDLWIWPIKDACFLWNPALNHPGGFFGYILRCLMRHLLRLPKPGEVDPDALTDKDIQKWLSTSLEVRDSLLVKALKQCVQELPPQQREVCILRLDQQLDDSEIAKRLGVSEGNVRITYWRALHAILNCLKKKRIQL